jgi:hypothetical protein
LDNLFALVDEKHNSIVAPYLERLYSLIDKKDDTLIAFDEFVSAVSAFCLFSKDQMVTCKFFNYQAVL